MKIFSVEEAKAFAMQATSVYLRPEQASDTHKTLCALRDRAEQVGERQEWQDQITELENWPSAVSIKVADVNAFFVSVYRTFLIEFEGYGMADVSGATWQFNSFGKRISHHVSSGFVGVRIQFILRPRISQQQKNIELIP